MLKCTYLLEGYTKGANMFEKLEKLQIVTLAVILALGMIVTAKVVTNSLAKDEISVTGSSFQIVTSDSARLEFEVTSRAADKAIAYENIKKQMPIVIKYLTDKGFTQSDIELKAPNGYNTFKYNSNGNMTNEIAYYNLTQPVAVNSKNVAKIKEISTDISNLISKGVDINAFQPSYFYSKLSDLKVKLLEDATTDAKQRASAMLKATHNSPGKIQSVKMGVFQITPVDSTNVSDSGINDTTTVEKKVTSVANVVFRIK